jgi:hypothetical protein
VSVDFSRISGLLARFRGEAILHRTSDEFEPWPGKIAVALDCSSHMPGTLLVYQYYVAKEKGASRRRRHVFAATQFKSSTVPAITNAQPPNITSGQRLRG